MIGTNKELIMSETADTLEQRIMKSNLSDDKIELIKRLNQQVIVYTYKPYEPAIYGQWEFTC